MDSLDQLPLPNVNITPDEESVVNRYFGGDSPSKKDEQKGGSKLMKAIKLAAITLLIFILLANPWVQGIYCKLPYCSSQMLGFAFQSLLFFLVLAIVLWFTL